MVVPAFLSYAFRIEPSGFVTMLTQEQNSSHFSGTVSEEQARLLKKQSDKMIRFRWSERRRGRF
jgi:hypothetical protein